MKNDKASIKSRNIGRLTKGNKTKLLKAAGNTGDAPKEFIRMRNTSEVQHLMDKAKAKSGKEGDTEVIKHALLEFVSV